MENIVLSGSDSPNNEQEDVPEKFKPYIQKIEGNLDYIIPFFK